MAVWLLTRVDFDSLENHHPTTETLLGVFDSPPTIEWYIRSTRQPAFSVGWDGQVYPKYKVERRQVITEKDLCSTG